MLSPGPCGKAGGREGGCADLAAVLKGHLLGQRQCRRIQHAVGDLGGTALARGQPEGREDVHVVALVRVDGLAVLRAVLEGTARGEDAPTVRPIKCLLEGTLGLRGGVGHGHDHGALSVGTHVLDNLAREDAWAARHADQRGRVHARDDLGLRGQAGEE